MRQPRALTCLSAVLAAAVVSFGARMATAQQPPAPPPGQAPPGSASAPSAAPEPAIVVAPVTAESVTTPQATLAPNVVTSSAPSPAAAGLVGDHASMVGHWAVGYLGISSLPIGAGCCDTNGLPQLGTVSAPVLGVRYWFRDALGVDVGLGLGVQTGTAQPSAYGFAFHAGLPIVLAQGRHTAFEVTPEATVGFTTGTIPVPAGGVSAQGGNVGGLLLRAGARVGAEVHFGFIGLPELALQATVGLYWRTETYHYDQNDGVSISASSTLITTSVNDSPWGIFTDTISALYYF